MAKPPVKSKCTPLSSENSFALETQQLDLFTCYFASMKRSFAISLMVCILQPLELFPKGRVCCVCVCGFFHYALGAAEGTFLFWKAGSCPVAQPPGLTCGQTPSTQGRSRAVAPFPRLELRHYLKSLVKPWPSVLYLPQPPGLFRGSLGWCSAFFPKVWLVIFGVAVVAHITLNARVPCGRLLFTESSAPQAHLPSS